MEKFKQICADIFHGVDKFPAGCFSITATRSCVRARVMNRNRGFCVNSLPRVGSQSHSTVNTFLLCPQKQWNVQRAGGVTPTSFNQDMETPRGSCVQGLLLQSCTVYTRTGFHWKRRRIIFKSRRTLYCLLSFENNSYRNVMKWANRASILRFFSQSSFIKKILGHKSFTNLFV